MRNKEMLRETPEKMLAVLSLVPGFALYLYIMSKTKTSS